MHQECDSEAQPIQVSQSVFECVSLGLWVPHLQKYFKKY